MKTKLFKLFLFVFAIFLCNSNFSSAQMFWNQAAFFAVNGFRYLIVPHSASLNLTGSFSIEAWVNPELANLAGIVSKGFQLGSSLDYGIRLSNHKITINTNGFSRLTSRASNQIPLNQWTHITGTYNSSTDQFSIYINGVLDTTSIVPGAAPPSSSDPVYIGISSPASNFKGKMDEVRLWNRELSATEVHQFFRSSIGANTGIYSGLVMSHTFQSNHAIVNNLNLEDKSGNNNNAINAGGVAASNLSDRPLQTIVQNECAEFDGTDDYLSAQDDPVISPTSEMTLEAWVYLRNSSPATFITKGSNYRLGFNGVQITFGINNNFFATGVGLPAGSWNHLALTYSGITGIYSFYLNGVLRKTDTLSLGNVIDGTDSLFVGGGGLFSDLNGFIDEVRISTSVKSQILINQFLYQSIDSSNHPFSHAVYNLDGLNSSGSADAPKISFRNNSRFSHPGGLNNPVSPLNRNDNSNFSEGYFMKTVNKKIPATGTAGTVSDSTFINLNTTISDINLFVALNHTNSENLDVVLVAPNNDSVKVFDSKNTISEDDNLVTIFNDEADSSLVTNKYVTFSTIIKPENNMNNAFTGDNAQGRWKLIVRDDQSNDDGFLYAWGIQLNNSSQRSKDLDLSVLIQGFYNPSTNLLIEDTVKAYIRSNVSPFSILDSATAKLNSSGLGLFGFQSENVVYDQQYYIQLEHRNSIETWSNLFSFGNDEAVYTFLGSASSAFGSNQAQVDNSPLRFAIYSGDVNKDGSVELTDIVNIFNDANIFLSGYVLSDVNGDNFVDLSDLTLTVNNSNEFVSVIRP